MKPKKILIIDSGAGTTYFCLAEAKYPLVFSRPPLKINNIDKVELGGRNIDKEIFSYIKNIKQLNITTLEEESILRKIQKKKNNYNFSKKTDMVVDLFDNNSVSVPREVIDQCITNVLDEIIRGIN